MINIPTAVKVGIFREDVSNSCIIMVIYGHIEFEDHKKTNSY